MVFSVVARSTSSAGIPFSWAINLAHEVAHTLRLREVYNNAYRDYSQHDIENPNCVMCVYPERPEGMYNSIVAGTNGLCDYCIGKILLHGPDNAYEE